MMTAKAKTATPIRVDVPKRGRYYRLGDEQWPSVTTILKVGLAKPALVGWAANTVATEAVQNLVRVTRMSRTDREGAAKWLAGRPYAQRDAAASLGSRLHDLAEKHALGEPYSLPDEDSDEAAMLGQFLRFLDDFQPQYEATEAVVLNRSIGYAGTLDALMRLDALDRRLVVCDYKTGKSGPYPEWALQLCAYAYGEQMWLRDGSHVDMPKTEGAVILRIRPDEYALHEVTLSDALLDTFAAMCQVARWLFEAEEASPISQPIAGPLMTVLGKGA